MEKIRAQEKYWKDIIVKHINPSIFRSPYNSTRKTNMNVFPGKKMANKPLRITQN